ncbi:unnamed protein product [Thelazia callipaeda]|uniref:Ovule protein n=1 Tax=Thelazia callipaeda TaxID=103827 RepID=A0A0N5D873_THECL|nr:unnamed protein product [Thelazia callipaeda]
MTMSKSLYNACKHFSRSLCQLPHLQQHTRYKHLPKCARFITYDKKSKISYQVYPSTQISSFMLGYLDPRYVRCSKFLDLTAAVPVPSTVFISSVQLYSYKVQSFVLFDAPFIIPSSHTQLKMGPAFTIPQQHTNFSQDGSIYTSTTNPTVHSLTNNSVN